MGSAGQSVRNTVRGMISNTSIRSSATLTPITRTKGDLGGYEAVTETESSSRTIYVVASDYIKELVETVKFGDLRTGEVRLIARDDEILDTNDKIAFENQTYHIRQISPIFFNDVTIAQELTLSETVG